MPGDDLPVRSDEGEEQEAEPDEDAEVRRADDLLAEEPGMAERLAEHAEPALPREVASSDERLTDTEDADHATRGPGDQGQRKERDHDGDDGDGHAEGSVRHGWSHLPAGRWARLRRRS